MDYGILNIKCTLNIYQDLKMKNIFKESESGPVFPVELDRPWTHIMNTTLDTTIFLAFLCAGSVIVAGMTVASKLFGHRRIK